MRSRYFAKICEPYSSHLLCDFIRTQCSERFVLVFYLRFFVFIPMVGSILYPDQDNIQQGSLLEVSIRKALSPVHQRYLLWKIRCFKLGEKLAFVILWLVLVHPLSIMTKINQITDSDYVSRITDRYNRCRSVMKIVC